ncbi:hypothetical protein IFM89_028933 [Coptis chinensis]|uniref:Protein kinase domain-containing protein n=1 Tax=Coptis chinensis TaxID=261450 RepID=A0A835H7X4_9MAGN|nr:hypothetical protein IFM89_028933 [Coptis chinensis]
MALIPLITYEIPYEDKIQAKKDNSTHNKEQQDVGKEFTKENPKKESTLPTMEPSVKESMSQGVNNHVFWVFGNKTANVRDLFKFGRKLGQGQIGSTYLCIENSTGINERKAAKLTRIVVEVIETCQSLGVMHRDLKPDNFVLVNKDNDFSLKAIDFGFSVFFKPGIMLLLLSFNCWVPHHVMERLGGIVHIRVERSHGIVRKVLERSARIVRS